MSQSHQPTKSHAKAHSAAESSAQIDAHRDRLAEQLDGAIRRVVRAQSALEQLQQDLREYAELAPAYRVAQANAEGVEGLRQMLERSREHIKPRNRAAPAEQALH